MKIVIVNNNVFYQKDSGLYVYKETGKFFCELKELGAEVSVFQFRMRSNNSDFLADFNLINKGLNIISIARSKRKFWPYIKAFILGFSTIKKSDYAYFFYPGHICTVFAVFCLITKTKYGFYIRGEKNIMSRISRFLYKKADTIMTISPKFTENILSLNSETKTIRPMMEIGERDIINDRQYLFKTNYQILYVGRIEEPKGLYDLIKASEMLVSNNIRNFSIHLVGDGPDLEIMKEIVSGKNLKSFFYFHGTITNFEKLKEFYTKSDIFILPTHHEGFPRVLYEAMIFGIPILTTFVGSISHLMKDNYNCYEIKPKNPQDIFQKLNTVLLDYKSKACVARNGTKTIIDYLSDKNESHAQKLYSKINN